MRAEIGGRAAYLDFWDDYRAVELGEVQAEDGSLEASAPVTFVSRNGNRSPEQHRITLVRGDDGRLLVDYDVPV